MVMVMAASRHEGEPCEASGAEEESEHRFASFHEGLIS
jgi:hypothetical protein